MPISGGMSEKQVSSGVCCWMSLEDMSWISQSWRDKYWVDGSIYIYIHFSEYIYTHIYYTHTEYVVRFSDTKCGGCAWNCRKGTWGIRIAWVSLEKMTVLEMGNEQCGWAQHTPLKMVQMTGIMCVFCLNGKQPDGVIWVTWSSVSKNRASHWCPLPWVQEFCHMHYCCSHGPGNFSNSNWI